jgi:hypothetical protein
MRRTVAWEEIQPGQVEALIEELPAVYQISVVPSVSKKKKKKEKKKIGFRVQVTTETGAFNLPKDYDAKGKALKDFDTMGEAKAACLVHLYRWIGAQEAAKREADGRIAGIVAIADDS